MILGYASYSDIKLRMDPTTYESLQQWQVAFSEEREKRYREKFEFAQERIQDVEILLQDFDDKFKRLACYKAFQEVVETIFDVMILKDRNKVVEDDYTNIEKIESMKLISEEDSKVLREANGLRKRLIHRYNRTDDRIARESIENLLPDLERILKGLIGYGRK